MQRAPGAAMWTPPRKPAHMQTSGSDPCAPRSARRFTVPPGAHRSEIHGEAHRGAGASSVMPTSSRRLRSSVVASRQQCLGVSVATLGEYDVQV